MSKDSRFISWKEEYSWDNCKLKNGDYGRFLSSYLRSQNTPLVINLDGGWGTGKTTFLRQLYTDLSFTHGYACIYIDAWESDYSNDPLLVIVSELLEQLKCISANFQMVDKEEKVLAIIGKFGKVIWNSAVVGVGEYLSSKVDNVAFTELARQVTFSNNDSVVLGRSLSNGYQQQKNALNDARKALEILVECIPSHNNKVFILIDELDRCRPSYAIEMLETIKHFFELKNYVFVVATDTEQLSHSVKAVYGDFFDGKEYLSRFFSRSAKLPQPNRKDFSKIMVEKMSDDNLKSVFSINNCSNIKDSLTHSFSELGEIYSVSLRRLEQIANKFESIAAYSKEVSPKLLIDANLLIQLLIEFDSSDYRVIYEARKRSKSYNITIPKTIVEKSSNTGSNPLKCVAIIVHGHEYSNNEYNSFSFDKYHFSWLFSTYPRRIKNQSVFNIIDVANDYLNYLLNNSDATSSQIKMHLNHILEYCNQSGEEYKMALPEDYYKFVELAKLQSV